MNGATPQFNVGIELGRLLIVVLVLRLPYSIVPGSLGSTAPGPCLCAGRTVRVGRAWPRNYRGSGAVRPFRIGMMGKAMANPSSM